MRIKRNLKLEGQILERAREFLDKQDRAAGIHVSSLMTPRKFYWQQMKPKPLTDKEVGYFIAGRAHHEVIQAIMKKADKIADSADEGSREWEGIWYSVDLRLGFLAEIKSSRRQFAPPDNDEDALLTEYDNYLDQLSKYMAVEQKQRASLIIFYISMRNDDANKTTFPQIRAYDVGLTEDEIKKIRREMVERRELIKKSLKKKDHTILPLCPAWQCTRGGIKGPAIEECKWYRECKPEGRYPLSLVEENLKKQKKGADLD